MATLSRERVELLKAVLDYVRTNPDAKDTLEGIRQWWLPSRHMGATSSDLHAVLDYLVQTQWLVAIESPGGTLYGSNHEPAAERVQ
jgi:hypothetical protein